MDRFAASEKYLEENRFLCLDTRLGPNELLLESFSGVEGISKLFSFQLELLSLNRRIKFEDILGQEISFGVMGPDEIDKPRYFHGLVTAFAQLSDSMRFARYRAIVSPKLWTLTRKQDCRIFQNQKVPDIVENMLREMGIDVNMNLREPYSPREYCVQYRETDFNFISRLMEEEGIFYYFRHSKDKHTMIMADSKSAYETLPGNAKLYFDDVAGGVLDEGRICNWTKTQHLDSGAFSLRDYNFMNPTMDLTANQKIIPSVMVGKVSHQLNVGGNAGFEIYDYPGGYENKGQGETYSKLSMEQLEASQFLIQGESNVFAMIPGYQFNLSGHPNADGAYGLTSVSHTAKEGGFTSSAEIGQNHYKNTFCTIPASLSFRPHQTATRPHVWGSQTAVVVGSAGEEIYPDKYGRVKVQFYWDRIGHKDQGSSCWIRVATHWAGKQWGMIHLPRIGQEVVVDFLEGDPDRPIIVGSVYNATNMPPYDLPANKTQSGIKSDSSLGGGGYNQIRFEDKKGNEEVLVHAQKDMNMKVEHDRSIQILHDDTVKITNDRTTEVGKDCSTKVGGTRKMEAGKEIILETGSARIVMKANGDIKISGVNITISAEGSLKSQASATHIIKGSLVQIN